ncbi:hypothetical protein AB0J43_58620, partial [Nonomuraea fuscirosea]
MPHRDRIALVLATLVLAWLTDNITTAGIAGPLTALIEAEHTLKRRVPTRPPHLRGARPAQPSPWAWSCGQMPCPPGGGVVLLTCPAFEGSPGGGGLSTEVNQHCEAQGRPAHYTHTLVANWISGMVPRWPNPQSIAAALSERLGQPVSVAEIGMPQLATTSPEIGLDFPRELPRAIDVAAAWWTLGDRVNRRAFGRLAFAAAAFTTPSTRWLIQPADADAG